MKNPDETHWLQSFLDKAIQDNVCTNINCTTCGSRDFRKGLLKALYEAKNLQPPDKFDHEVASHLIDELKRFSPPTETRGKYESIIRFLIYDIRAVWLGNLKASLEGSYAGDVFNSMEEHHEQRMQAWRHHEERNDPVKAGERREEQKRLRQEKHQERLELKKERDRIWWEKQK